MTNLYEGLRLARVASLEKGRNMARVLVIAPHPDDEVLGCGGTMAKRALGGDKV